MAIRCLRRHLVAKKGDQASALSKMQATMKWREDMRVNELRRCFDSPDDDDDQERRAAFWAMVEAEHAVQKSYVSGFDKEHHAVVTKYHRTVDMNTFLQKTPFTCSANEEY